MIEVDVYVGNQQVGSIKTEVIPRNNEWLRIGATVYQVVMVAWVPEEGKEVAKPIVSVLRVDNNSPFIARVGLLEPEKVKKSRNSRS